MLHFKVSSCNTACKSEGYIIGVLGRSFTNQNCFTKYKRLICLGYPTLLPKGVFYV